MKRTVSFLIAILLLTGCAGKKAQSDHAAAEQSAPVIAVQTEATPDDSPPTEPKEVIPETQEITVDLSFDSIFFDFDSYLLTTAGKDILKENALVLKAHPETRILIEGHTDERGSDTYNLALGEKRAQATREYLQNLGVAPERLATISYGEEKAVEAAGDDSIWAQNRRADFVIAQ